MYSVLYRHSEPRRGRARTRPSAKKQYEDEVSWSTRTWQALMAQRMSVTLHLAAAWEIAVELKGVGAEEDEAALFGAAASDA